MDRHGCASLQIINMERLVPDQRQHRRLDGIVGQSGAHLLLACCRAHVERFEDISGACHQTCAIADEVVGSFGSWAEDRSGHGEDVAPLFERIIDGDQRAGKSWGVGRVPGGNSEISAPWSVIRRARVSCRSG